MKENKSKKHTKFPKLDEDQVEKDILSASPVSFLIVGKPGCGKTTLAELLSSTWKCVHVNDTLVLEEASKTETELGKQAKDVLCSGESLTEELILQLLLDKLQSSSIQHYGYVLDCLPAVSQSKADIEEQLKFVKKVNPTVIIHLKISDQDLAKRRNEQRVDMSTAGVRISSLTQTLSSSATEESSSPTENTEEEEEEDKRVELNVYDEELKQLSIPEVPMNPGEPWVRKPQDTMNNIQEELSFYKKNMLLSLEDFIVNHNRQHLIELDANIPPKELFKSVLIALDSRGLCRCPVPKRLFVTDDDDDVGSDGLDTEEFLKQLSEMSNILPKFRWRRSKWSRYCPVKLVEGNLTLGKMEFSVGFMDRMYCLSSTEAMEKFVVNPRLYLLPPYPLIPCKICVVGPPTSGRTTLAKAIAENFDAMVLDIGELIAPYISLETKKAIEMAKEEAEVAAMNQLAIEQAKSSDKTEITRDHPDVIRAVEDAVQFAQGTFVATEEMYIDAIKGGIALAEERKAERTEMRPAFGGWIIDGFPKTRDHWAALVENDILPDSLIILDDHEAPENYLFSRFTGSYTISSDSDEPKTEGELAAQVSDLLAKWKKTKAEHDKHMEQLIATAKGSAVDPQIINCSLPKEKIISEAVDFLEGIFAIRPAEFTFADEDVDADDDPVLESDNIEGEEEAGEDEESSRKAKPWGDSKHYCPVALKELDVLWPGSDDYCLKYKERLYCFSNEEAKEKFMKNPEDYVATTHLLKPPPMRIFILGPKNSGKTIIGRKFAAKYNLFHISFREYLQEEILSKVSKPPLVDDDEWEGESPPEDEEYSENKEELTDDEAEIKGYLTRGDPPSDELFKKYTERFWFSEPYKSSGFVLEGFPTKPEEAHVLAGCGLFPDAVVILEVDEDGVIKRTLPRRLSIWKKKRNERLLKRKQNRDKIMAEWEKDKNQRKADVKAEYSERIAAVTRKSTSNEDDEEEDEAEQLEEEQQERLAEIDEEDPPEIEEELEEEDESEATDRMKASLSEQYQECVEQISQIQEVCAELKIPTHGVNASKKEPVVEYSINKSLSPYANNRQGIFIKCTPVDAKMAKVLLDSGYKHLSDFQKWCPVKTLQCKYNILPPMQWNESEQYPVICRQHLYYLSSAANRELFIANPLKFLRQTPPGPAYPVTLSVVGPPKSGKTTIANRFCQEYGCIRLSIGEVLRRQITTFPNSTLAEIIQSHLKSGEVVPDDICALALESALLDIQCATRGYVLDGWPLTKNQTDRLSDCHIIPVCVLELVMPPDEVLRRARKDREYSERSEPVHNSDLIISERSKQYYESIKPVNKWYSQEHDNWHRGEGNRSIWWIWDQCNECALYTAKQIQQYISRTPLGKVAPIHGLCVTPSEFEAALGEFSKYCPVDLALHGELVDCSEGSLQFAAEYRHKYYKMCCEEDLELFLANPDSFVLPETAAPLPSLLPKRKSQSEVKSLFPKQFEINGFCSVCYVFGKESYESLKPGSSENVAEYDDKLYCFCDENHLGYFMRKPGNFATLQLPSKLPPVRDATPLDTLPILGFLEQTVSSAIIESLSAVGLFKPKYPFWSSTNSALYFVALHLKAFNSKSNNFVRQTYKHKLTEFKGKCELIGYLSSEMYSGYQEPQARHISFDHKMNTFVNLKTNSIMA